MLFAIIAGILLLWIMSDVSNTIFSLVPRSKRIYAFAFMCFIFLPLLAIFFSFALGDLQFEQFQIFPK